MGLPLFYTQFRLRFNLISSSDLFKNKIINEGLITYSSNRKKQEDRIMKTATFTKSLTVSMQPETFEQIKEITDAKRISMGQWIRDAVEAALEKVK